MLRIHATEDTAVLSVQDFGAGISDDRKRTLFNAFARGKTVKAGGEHSVGPGLTISKKIVDGYGRRIRVGSTVGNGSTFVLSLPLSGPDRETAACEGAVNRGGEHNDA